MDDSGDDSPEGAASRIARSRKQLANRKIEDLLKPGQTVLCQVTKDAIGQKGARVTGYLSMPGRYSVFMPHVAQVGVSRRIGSDKERRRLRDLVNEVRPKGSGFIVRTAAEDANDQELRDDVDFLARLWGEVDKRQELMSGAGLVYADLDLSLRVVRDLLREDTTEVMIDDQEQYERVLKFTQAFLPRFSDRIKKYEGRRPIFDHYHIEPALRVAVSRRVPLRSGGSLVIDQGEALTAIDVNTGSFTNTGSGNLEDTVTANNLEACDEVARQLRLRNIGGIIVIDFVDMDKEGNRRKVWDAFQKALSRDRARTNVTKISELGLVEMTRKRTRESLVQLLTEPCPICEGAGVVKSVTTVAYEIMREVRRSGTLVDTDRIEIEASPLEDELTLVNNRAVVAIDGVRDKLRVLLVSGEPHSGERTWRNLLKSDASVDLVHFTILRPPEKQDGTPINELSLIAFPTRELFQQKINEFQLIIFDRYARQGVLPIAYFDNIARYVRAGGAVLVSAGPDYASTTSIWRTPLAGPT